MCLKCVWVSIWWCNNLQNMPPSTLSPLLLPYSALYALPQFCPTFSDIAVGAPYADNGDNNQGAVYIYYGRADIAEFAQQTPFEVQQHVPRPAFQHLSFTQYTNESELSPGRRTSYVIYESAYLGVQSCSNTIHMHTNGIPDILGMCHSHLAYYHKFCQAFGCFSAAIKQQELAKG